MGENDFTTKEDWSRLFRMTRGLTWERIQSIIIVILFIIILLLKNCGDGGEGKKEITEPTRVITKIDTVWSEVQVEKKIYVPKWRTKIDTVRDTVTVNVPVKIDTTEILKEYYSFYQYIDTIKIDSIGFVILTDTISKNTILHRGLNKSIKIPTKEITITEYINNREFYTGFGARTNGTTINWMGLEGAFRNKNGNLFLIGVGTDVENNLSFGGSVHWKIGRK